MQEIWQENNNNMAKTRKWCKHGQTGEALFFFFSYEVGTRESFSSANRQIDALMYDFDAELQSNRNSPEDEKDQDTKVK